MIECILPTIPTKRFLQEDIQVRKARNTIIESNERIQDLQSLIQETKNSEVIAQAKSLIEFMQFRAKQSQDAIDRFYTKTTKRRTRSS